MEDARAKKRTFKNARKKKRTCKKSYKNIKHAKSEKCKKERKKDDVNVNYVQM